MVVIVSQPITVVLRSSHDRCPEPAFWAKDLHLLFTIALHHARTKSRSFGPTNIVGPQDDVEGGEVDQEIEMPMRRQQTSAMEPMLS